MSSKMEIGENKELKLVVVGDGYIGKTCMLWSFVHKNFPEQSYTPTIFDIQSGKKIIFICNLKLSFLFCFPFKSSQIII